MDGAHGPVYTTSDIVDEAFTLILSRAGSKGWGMVEVLGGFVGITGSRPTVATVLDAGLAVHEEAWPVFEEHFEDRGLSWTDCTSLVAMRRFEIEQIASFDAGFDGLVERIMGG